MQINTRRDQGSIRLHNLQAQAITNLTVDTFGLVPASLTQASLSQDPTRNNPYDNLNDGTTLYLTLTIPANTEQVVAEIIASEAPDLDLYVGVDSDLNGLPSASELLCAGGKTDWREMCRLDGVASATVWVVVQNYQQSAAAPDAVSPWPSPSSPTRTTANYPATARPAYPLTPHLTWMCSGICRHSYRATCIMAL
ncbi:MAG: hypothetical protein IPL78_24025 [Chloroflexi bacterium]|nr:hypothetical protein [Chloroflexota bacterium]